MTNRVKILYCPKCNWLMRSAWMMQELMVTFNEELLSVQLEKGTTGTFQVFANDQLIWDRKERGSFPEITTLKQLVRDIIAPDKSLGHSDKKNYNIKQ